MEWTPLGGNISLNMIDSDIVHDMWHVDDKFIHPKSSH